MMLKVNHVHKIAAKLYTYFLVTLLESKPLVLNLVFSIYTLSLAKISSVPAAEMHVFNLN